MNQESYFSDSEISDLAKEVIRHLVRTLKAPVEMFEDEREIKLIVRTSNDEAGIFFNPQKRIEEILRETEAWAFENLKDEVPPEDFMTAIYQHIWLTAYYDEELKSLIERLALSCKPALKKLEDTLRKHKQKASDIRDAALRKENDEIEEVERLKEFAKKVNEVKPLWEFIIRYFEERDYKDCIGVDKEEEYKRLAASNSVPQELIREVFKRQADLGTQRYRYEPLSFAIRHSAAITQISGKPDSLQKKYYKGLNYLKADSLFKLTDNQPDR